MVLLPLPLSPTSARISARRSVNETSSTACTKRGSPPSPKGPPPPAGKNLLRPWTSSTTSSAARTAHLPSRGIDPRLIQVAGGQMVLSHRVEGWVGADTLVHHVYAARREPAAGRGSDQIRGRAGDALQAPLLAADRGEGVHQ